MVRFIVGLDLSLSATGVVVLAYGGKTSKMALSLVASAVCSAPKPDGTESDKGLRLHELTRVIIKEIARHVPQGANPNAESFFYAEGYSFGSRNARERIGETHGAIISGIWREFISPVLYVTPAAAKRVACPDHYGWSKDHWERARKPGKWKRSMPDKEQVIYGIHKRFGLRFATDGEADAFCVAYAGLMSHLWYTVSGKISDDRVF